MFVHLLTLELHAICDLLLEKRLLRHCFKMRLRLIKSKIHLAEIGMLYTGSLFLPINMVYKCSERSNHIT